MLPICHTTQLNPHLEDNASDETVKDETLAAAIGVEALGAEAPGADQERNLIS